MKVSTPVCVGCKAMWFRRLVLACLGLTGAAALNLAGCPKPQFQQLYPNATLAQINTIVSDTTLTDADKTTQLNDLGITDVQVIHVLLGAPLPTGTTSSTTG